MENGGDTGNRWLSLLWNADTRGLLPQTGEDGTLPPREAQATVAELMKSHDRAINTATSWPDTNFILWLPKEQDQAVRIISHLLGPNGFQGISPKVGRMKKFH